MIRRAFLATTTFLALAGNARAQFVGLGAAAGVSNTAGAGQQIDFNTLLFPGAPLTIPLNRVIQARYSLLIDDFVQPSDGGDIRYALDRATTQVNNDYAATGAPDCITFGFGFYTMNSARTVYTNPNVRECIQGMLGEKPTNLIVLTDNAAGILFQCTSTKQPAYNTFPSTIAANSIKSGCSYTGLTVIGNKSLGSEQIGVKWVGVTDQWHTDMLWMTWNGRTWWSGTAYNSTPGALREGDGRWVSYNGGFTGQPDILMDCNGSGDCFNENKFYDIESYGATGTNGLVVSSNSSGSPSRSNHFYHLRVENVAHGCNVEFGTPSDTGTVQDIYVDYLRVPNNQDSSGELLCIKGNSAQASTPFNYPHGIHINNAFIGDTTVGSAGTGIHVSRTWGVEVHMGDDFAAVTGTDIVADNLTSEPGTGAQPGGVTIYPSGSSQGWTISADSTASGVPACSGSPLSCTGMLNIVGDTTYGKLRGAYLNGTLVSSYMTAPTLTDCSAGAIVVPTTVGDWTAATYSTQTCKYTSVANTTGHTVCVFEDLVWTDPTFTTANGSLIAKLPVASSSLIGNQALNVTAPSGFTWPGTSSTMLQMQLGTNAPNSFFAGVKSGANVLGQVGAGNTFTSGGGPYTIHFNGCYLGN